ncbi:MAG TPA: adenosylcobinamide-phosphate synthase CbiB [Burkholderiales bacterium]|nr:adenosylcobinamide-phosphate synthase CbiB [Burkholderiales bacterium]
MITLLVVVLALALDSLLGEPKRFHPLVLFGRYAGTIERRFYAAKPNLLPLSLREKGWGEGNSVSSGKNSPSPWPSPGGRGNYWRGAFAVCIAIVPLASLAALTALTPFAWILDALLLYLAVGWHSLNAHARPIRDALHNNEIARARQQVGMMVSRDTAAMKADDVSKAAVESVLENGNDAIFGALFWFVVAGAPGAVAYRLANTLDAMWGYRNERYAAFGWAAARLDDALNFIPARLTALSYAIVGHTRSALRCWDEQARHWDSPNAGPVMASGAGSLRLALGGPASYHGKLEDRPVLGGGATPQALDIDRALKLVDRSLALWLIVLSGGALLAYTF